MSHSIRENHEPSAHRIEPIDMEDVARLETYVRRHRSVGILRVADDLGWSAIKVLKVASASSLIRIPRQRHETGKVLDWIGEGGISTSVDFPMSTESRLLPCITGLATNDLQEILIDRLTKLATLYWTTLPGDFQNDDSLITIIINLINRKTIHELCHVLGKCNETATSNAEAIIPIQVGGVTFEIPCLPVSNLMVNHGRAFKS